MDYITVREAAEKWHLAERTVQQLCRDGGSKAGVNSAAPERSRPRRRGPRTPGKTGEGGHPKGPPPLP